MARGLRIEYPGAIYHVMVRGNNREAVFSHCADKSAYLDIIRKYRVKYHFIILAYALLPNHCHLALQVSHVPLSKIMQGIQQVYTQYYNTKYDRVGHVFQQRYNAKVCEREEYLLEIIRYIHRNPYRAGLSQTLCYPWSSHNDYLNPDEKGVITDVSFVLGLIGSNREKAFLDYSTFMSRYVTEQDCLENRGSLQERETLDPLDKLLDEVSIKTGVPQKAILSRNRIKEAVAARRDFIAAAIELENKTQKEIADYLGVSQSTVTQVLNRKDD